MTEYIVPMVDPIFWNGGIWTGPLTDYTWVGTAPYVDTADTDASYGQVDGTSLSQRVGATLAPWSAPGAVTAVRIEAELWRSTAWTGKWLICDVSGVGFWVDGTDWTGPAGWSTITHTFTAGDPTYYGDMALLLSVLAAGDLLILAVCDGSTLYRASMVRLVAIVPEVLPNLTGQLLEDRVRFT